MTLFPNKSTFGGSQKDMNLGGHNSTQDKLYKFPRVRGDKILSLVSKLEVLCAVHSLPQP